MYGLAVSFPDKPIRSGAGHLRREIVVDQKRGSHTAHGLNTPQLVDVSKAEAAL